MSNSMRTLRVTLTVTPDCGEELDELARSLKVGNRLDARGIDGQSVLGLVATLQVTSVPVLIAWVRARAEQKRMRSFSVDDIKLDGYSANDIIKIVELLNDRANPVNSRDSEPGTSSSIESGDEE